MIINDQGWGSIIGSGLGQGLSQGLGVLAQQKLQQLANQQMSQRTMSGLQSLGFTPEQSQQLAGLEPAILQQVVKQKLAEPGQKSYANALSAILGGNNQGTGQLSQAPDLTGLNERQAGELTRLAFKKQDIDLKKKSAEDKKSERLQTAIDKETQPYADKISSESDAAREGNDRLKEMVQVIHGGDLDNPVKVAAIERLANIPVLGIDLSSWLTADTQKLQKLSADFIKNAKNIFGSRITDADLKAFLKTVPTATQSDEGKVAVINRLMELNEGALIKENLFNEIIEKNNGIRPKNIKQEVEKRAKP